MVLQYKKINEFLGVQLTDAFDITTFSDEGIARLRELISTYHLVVINGKRKWTEEEQQRLTSRIGTIELPVVYSVPPTQVEQNGTNGKTTKGAGVFWHSDNSYQEQPSHLSVFQMVEIPKSGTKTSFASLINLYDRLSKKEKKSWGYFDVIYRDKVAHPLLWKHPFNGKKAVYFDIGFSTDITNRCENGILLPMKASNEIFNTINDLLSNEESLYEHDWSEGDIVVLDNYALAHRADILMENENRTLLRMTTKGIYF